MTNRPNLFEDVTRFAGDAANAFGSVKADVEMAVKQRLERMLEDCSLVRREEFDAVAAMAAAAREEQERLLARIADLEAKVEALSKSPSGAGKTKAAAKKTSTRKTAPTSDSAS